MGRMSDYWYENDPGLLKEEAEAMNHFFPSFKLYKLKDGRLQWHGYVHPDNVRRGASWELCLIYDHNHPHNSTYGGSVRVYSVEPDLNELRNALGGIPHLLRDPNGNVHICTARTEDIKLGRVQTSAASCLAWAVKWITVFELWMAGTVSTSEFENHTF